MVKSPCGVLNTTTAPGTNCSLIVVSTKACRAAWSIGFSPDVVETADGFPEVDGSAVEAGVDAGVGAELAAVVAAVDVEAVVVPLPQAADSRSVATPALMMARRRRQAFIW